MRRMRRQISVLLDKASRYLRTDARYLVESGFWLSLGQAVSMASGFALSVAFGNLVTKEVFGVYKFVFSLSGLLASFSPTAMGSAITQAVARGFDGALRQGFSAYARWSIVSVVLTLGVAGYYFVQGNSVLGISLLVVAVGSPLLSAFNLYSAFLKGKKDFRRDTLYGFFLSVVPTAALVSLMAGGQRESVPLFIGAYYLSMVAVSIFFHARTEKVYKPGGSEDPETLPYGLHLSAMSILGRVASYADKILLFHFIGAAPLAIYSFASAPPQYVLRLNGVLKVLGLPKLAERDLPTLKKTLPRKIAFHIAAAVIATVAYIVLAPYFFQIFFPQYLDAIPYSQVLGLTILSAPGVWFAQTLTAHMRTRELYVLNTANPIVKISLFLLLIPAYGIWGLVGATLLSGFFGSLLTFWMFYRLT